MNRSVTRGLAVSAVSALAMTGLSLVATPAAGAAAPDVELLSQFTGFASTRSDGTGSGSRLTASVGNPDAEVTFQVNADPEALDTDPGWRELGVGLGSPESPGNVRSVTWGGDDFNGRSYLGERVALRATATDTEGTSSSVRNNVEVSGDRSVESVSITTTAARYFTQPYVSAGRTSSTIPVAGATSADSGTVELSTWRQEDGTFTGRTAAEVEPVPAKFPDPESQDTGRFVGQLEVSAFDRDAGAVVVAAERDSDDVSAISLTPQTLRYIKASAPAVRPGERADVTIEVTDQDDLAVLGAEVRRLSDGSLVGYTDENGVVTTTQLDGETEEYYANATDLDGFSSEDGDPQSGPVSIATYEPVATYVYGILGDGDAFDVDEYAPGDLALLVLDNQNRPVGAGESVSYKVYPSDEDAPATYLTALTNDDGVAVVDFDATGATGEYTLAYVLTSQMETALEEVRDFTTGEAELLLSPRATPVEEAAGGQIDYFGRLVLAGEPLAGRRVDLSYARGVEVVPGNTADASIVTADGRVLETSRTTNANGSFRVTVDDSAETPQASEVDGVLTAATGDAVATETTTLDGNADAATTSVTRFGSGQPGSATVTLRGEDNGADADRLKVTGPSSLAGESVKVFRVNARGKRLLVTTRTLNASGDRPKIVVADENGRAATTYVVRLVASPRVQAADSNSTTLR